MLHSVSEGTSRRADLTFYRCGRIDICANAAKALGLVHGDVIDIASDGVEYYLYVKHHAGSVVGRHKGVCYPTKIGKRKSNNMRAYNTALTAAVLRIHHADVVALPVGKAVEVAGLGLALPIIVRNRL